MLLVMLLMLLLMLLMLLLVLLLMLILLLILPLMLMLLQPLLLLVLLLMLILLLLTLVLFMPMLLMLLILLMLICKEFKNKGHKNHGRITSNGSDVCLVTNFLYGDRIGSDQNQKATGSIISSSIHADNGKDKIMRLLGTRCKNGRFSNTLKDEEK